MSINETPHERFLTFARCSVFSWSVPSRLLDNGSIVLLRRFIRTKGEPKCDPLTLAEANLSYARIRYADSRESTVPTSDLAPCPGSPQSFDDVLRKGRDASEDISLRDTSAETPTAINPPSLVPGLPRDAKTPVPTDEPDATTPIPADELTATTKLRRSTRQRRPPERFGKWTV